MFFLSIYILTVGCTVSICSSLLIFEDDPNQNLGNCVHNMVDGGGGGEGSGGLK